MSSLTSSQIMSPYKRGTLMSMRWLRRLVYGRGNGVHSPIAFALIHSLVRPYSRYYDYDLIESYAAPEAMLWYRILARLRPAEVSYRLMDPRQREQLELMQTLAVSRLHPTGYRLLATDQVREAKDFLREKGRALVLLTKVRKDKESEREFIDYLMDEKHGGVVLDLYDCAIMLNNNHELYYYRTTL